MPGLKRSQKLAILHPIERENRITFNEVDHVYTVDGCRVPRSVTGLVHGFTNKFNPDEALQNIPSTEDRDAILRQWQTNGQVQAARGTLLHFHAEQLCNCREIQKPHSPELEQVIVICEHLKTSGFTFFRTEVNIFHNGLRVAGQPDLLCLDLDGNIAIIDWKRTKDIRMHGSFRSWNYPLQHLLDSNGWHYAHRRFNNRYKFYTHK